MGVSGRQGRLRRWCLFPQGPSFPIQDLGVLTPNGREQRWLYRLRRVENDDRNGDTQRVDNRPSVGNTGRGCNWYGSSASI